MGVNVRGLCVGGVFAGVDDRFAGMGDVFAGLGVTSPSFAIGY